MILELQRIVLPVYFIHFFQHRLLHVAAIERLAVRIRTP
ncbi:Uncharacterised protein [Klebsiella pneumoniae]|nr:Uncharacterised protein [Klebsiella pneumoniae]